MPSSGAVRMRALGGNFRTRRGHEKAVRCRKLIRLMTVGLDGERCEKYLESVRTSMQASAAFRSREFVGRMLWPGDEIPARPRFCGNAGVQLHHWPWRQPQHHRLAKSRAVNVGPGTS